MLTVAGRKTTYALLAALLFSISNAGCGSGQRAASIPPSTGTITVVDMAGREVKIPEKVESVAFIYSVIGYILAIGKADTLSAVPAVSDFFRTAHPVFETVGTVGRGQVDMEALAQLKPDLFIHRSSDIRTLNAVAELGIPSIGISIETREDVTAMLTLFGKALGAEDRANELIAYYDMMHDKARELSRDMPAEKRKTAVFLGSRIGSVANGAMLQSFMIEAAGGINCAKDVLSVEIWPVVGTETIFGWNPDFIFITNYGSPRYNVETLMNDPAWANMTAVKESQVYLVPTEKDSWEFPGASSSLGSLWMMSVMYPDKFSKGQLDAQVKEFYKKVYNIDVTPEFLGY